MCIHNTIYNREETQTKFWHKDIASKRFAALKMYALLSVTRIFIRIVLWSVINLMYVNIFLTSNWREAAPLLYFAE